MFTQKYAPKHFGDIAGHGECIKSIKTALALSQKRYRMTLLLSGENGIGKSAIAKLTVASCNCESGNFADACGSCDMCESIQRERFPLFIRSCGMDGGTALLDDLHELCLEKHFCFPGNPFYMFEEAHLLKANVQECILRFIDNPRHHFNFIFTTTNHNSLIQPLLQRITHRFYLKPVTDGEINDRLRHICDAERIKITAPALDKIASFSHGHVRNAVQMLERCWTQTSSEGDIKQDHFKTIDYTQTKSLREALKIMLTDLFSEGGMYRVGGNVRPENQVTSDVAPKLHFHALVGKVRFRISDLPAIRKFKELHWKQRRCVVPHFFRGPHNALNETFTTQDLQQRWIRLISQYFNNNNLRIPEVSQLVMVTDKPIQKDEDRKTSTYYLRNSGTKPWKKIVIHFDQDHDLVHVRTNDTPTPVKRSVPDFVRRYLLDAACNFGGLRTYPFGYFHGRNTFSFVITEAQKRLEPDGEKLLDRDIESIVSIAKQVVWKS